MRFVTVPLAIMVVWFIAQPAHAQEWEKIYPAWDTDGIEDMLHWGGDTLFAGGYNSTLLRSTDAGESWERVDLSGIQLSESHLYLNIKKLARLGNVLYFIAAPSFPPDRDSDNPFILEDSLLIVYQFSPSTGVLQDISIERSKPTISTYAPYIIEASEDHVWIVESTGSLSTIHRSDNRGQDWDALGSDREIVALSVLEDSVLIAVQQHENRTFLIRSTNVGASWSVHQDTVFIQRGSPYSFAEKRTDGGAKQYAICSANELLVSTDLGLSWNRMDPFRHGNRFFAVQALDVNANGDLYALTAGGALFRSSSWDGSWVLLREMDSETIQISVDATDMVCAGTSTVNISTSQGRFYHSENNGSDWVSVNIESVLQAMQIHFFDVHRGLLLANDSNGEVAMYSSQDAGRSWGNLGTAGTLSREIQWNSATWDSLSAVHLETGAQASNLIFYSSYDHGQTWNTIDEAIIPGRAQWAYTENGLYFALSRSFDTLWCSPDRGHSWNEITLPTGITINYRWNNLCVRKSQSGAPVTYVWTYQDTSKVLFRSNDYCKSWELVHSWRFNGSSRISDLLVTSKDTLLVEVSGIIDNSFTTVVEMSVDGGTTWNRVIDSDAISLNGKFIPLYPVVYRLEYGRQITMRKSVNIFSDFDVQFHRESAFSPVVFFLNADIGWIAAGQTIWHTTTGGTTWIQQPFTVTESAAITDIYPNPVGAGQSAVVNLTLPVGTITGAHGGAPLQVAVYDLLGREVAVLYNGPADPGTRTLTWEPSATLPAGMYMVRMMLGEKVWARQVAVVR